MKPLILHWGGGTTLSEVDATNGDKIIQFINAPIKFPTYVTSAYSGLGVKFKIIFQGIQNYIPDANGNKLPNTITNSLKIFNEFPDKEDEEFNASLPLFDITYSGDQVILNFKEDVEYPDTLKLPIVDSNGNQITTISADFGQNITSSKIIVPSGYTTIEEGAFQNNKNIQSVDLSMTSITTLPEYTFHNSSLETIQLPNSLKKIDRYVFEESNLTSIILNDGLEEMHACSFNRIKAKSIYIPASVNYISKDNIMFESDYLEQIIVDEDNPYFYDIDDACILSSDRFIKMAPLSKLANITIPEGVISIATCAFYKCTNIQRIDCPSTLQYTFDGKVYGCETFRYCYNLYEINIKSSVQWAIHDFDYTLITNMTLSGDVQRKTIEYCNELTTVTFDSKVTSVADIAVSNSSNVTAIIFESTTPPTFATTTFIGGTINSNLKIYVPDSAVSAYKAVNNLSNYASRIVGISTYTG